MGRLDRLELRNFKSYGGDVVVGPFKGFTAIIGTNGSGKSNLMDAISFVLGVRTTQLRGNQLRDLVYRNMEDPSDDVSQRRAHVKLVYRISDDPIQEIEFTRAVTLNGASEYRLNGNVVNLEAYNAKLAEIGVLVKARNFLVFQNEVENIASKNPKELSAMFEEVSESAEFRADYEQARSEKDAAEDEVTHFWRKRKNMAAEKRQYREQKEEAERYRRLQQQVADTKTAMALFELFHVDEDLRMVKAEVTDLTDELDEKEKQVYKREAHLKQEKDRIHKFDSDRLRLEKKKKRFADETEKLRPLEVKYETEKSSLGRRIKGDDRTLAKYQEEFAKSTDSINKLEGDLAKCREKIAAVDDEIKEAEAAILSNDSLSEYRALKDEVATKTSMLQEELESARRSLNVARNQKSALESRETDLEARIASVKRVCVDLNSRGEDLQAQTERNQEEIKKLRHERSQLAEVGEERDSVRRNLEKTVHETTHALRDAKADMTQNSREEAFNRALEKMQDLFPGVHGRLSDLCQPTQARYREAIAVIFGKMMDAVVVDNSRTGSNCINYLKEQRVGTATFIPLAEIRARPVDESLRRLGGTSRLAVDVLKHRDFVTKAVLYAAGNAVVCDTLQEARHIRYDGGMKIKICSLDGTLINKAGFMTGGVGRADMDRARKWDRGEIEALKRKRSNAQEELQKLGASDTDRRQVYNLSSKLDELTRGTQIIESDRRDCLSRIRGAERDAEQSSAELQQVGPQLKTAKAAFDKAKQKADDLEQQLFGLENELFGDFAQRHGIATVQEFEDMFVKKTDEIREKKLGLETEESKIETSLKYQKTQHGRSVVSKLEKKIEAQQARLEEVEDSLKGLAVKREEMESRASSLDSEIEEAVKKKQQAVDTLGEKRQEFRKESEALAEARKELQGNTSKLERLQSQRKKLLVAAKVAQVNIPSRDPTDSEEEDIDENGEGGTNNLQLDVDGDVEMGTTGGTDGEEGNSAPVQVNLNVCIDYSSLSRKCRASATTEKQKEMIDSYMDKIKGFEEQLDGLAPNMKATEHMTDVTEKLNEMEREAEAARERARKASSSFEQIKQKRQDRFNRCFDHVASKIQNVYMELTKSQAYPMGGTAYLSLEQQDEPYLSGIKYNAMPPTKRFRDMEQLSGGERTVAALALLFAIHDFRPSPFFVLDEVDAALDNLNVSRVSAYVRSRAPELQTIVISLKDTFFERADALVGIFRDVSLHSSRLLTLDLTQYDETPSSSNNGASSHPVTSQS